MSKEVLMVVESVSLEKGVPKEVIIDALEARARDGDEERNTAKTPNSASPSIATPVTYSTFRTWKVVNPDELPEEEEPNPAAQLTLEEARAKDPNLNLGDTYEIPVDSVEFGRIAAQTAKQVIVQKVREAERAQVVEAYQPRVGELVSGTVKKVRRESIIVDLGNNAEALLGRET